MSHDNTHERRIGKPSVPVMQMIDGKACWKAFGEDAYRHEPELERIWKARNTMQPYYDKAGITLYHGDCLKVMPQLEACSFDAVITDVPYGVTNCAWDSVIPFVPMWANLKRLARPRAAIVLFGSQPFTSALVMSNPEWYKYPWVWDKNNSAGFATAEYRPFIITEDISVFGNGAVNYYPQMTRGEYRTKGFGGATSDCYRLQPIKGEKNDSYYPKNIIPISKINSENNLHPTQKPLALMEYLVKTYTNEGDVILDFTSGSGTTLRAAKNLKRRAVGIEMKREYCEVTVKRLEPTFESAITVADSDYTGTLFEEVA